MKTLFNDSKRDNSSHKTTRAVAGSKIKQIALIFSALSVVALSILLNERLQSDQRPTYVLAGESSITQLNRAIASAQPLNLIEDLQSEQAWIDKLNQRDFARAPAAIGKAASTSDQLRYGLLAGKYRLAGGEQEVTELEYVDSNDVSDHPVIIQDGQAFLLDHKNEFAVHFEAAKVESKSALAEVFSLLNQSGQSLGRAELKYDSRGHLLSLKILQ